MWTLLFIWSNFISHIYDLQKKSFAGLRFNAYVTNYVIRNSKSLRRTCNDCSISLPPHYCCTACKRQRQSTYGKLWSIAVGERLVNRVLYLFCTFRRRTAETSMSKFSNHFVLHFRYDFYSTSVFEVCVFVTFICRNDRFWVVSGHVTMLRKVVLKKLTLTHCWLMDAYADETVLKII